MGAWVADSDNAASMRAQTGFLRAAQVVAPILVLVGTIYVGAQVNAFVGPAEMPVNSPLSAAMIMGVFMFPGGAFFISRGLVYWSCARQARFWPAVKGHIAEKGRALPSYWVPYWYVVNGIRYDKKLVRSGATPTDKDIEVHFNPEDPNIGVVLVGDATAQLNIGLAFFALAAPFPLAWLLVGLGG
jgi:hypothetical protein